MSWSRPWLLRYWCLWGAAVWTALLWTAAAWAEEPRRPNVVLFLVDDMGWMDCSPYGSQYYETPHMERLARQSMRFTDAYSLPLCSPTRASILTGMYSSRHGVTSASGHQPPQPADFKFLPDQAPANQPLRMPISKNYLDPAYYTLAEALADAGYRTGHFGKWHLGVDPAHWPERQGFQQAFHCEPSAGPPGAYFSPYGVVPPGTPTTANRGPRPPVGTITDGPSGEYITDRLTDEALKFVEANRDRPFFLNLWHYGVHGPWGHKPAYTAEFADKTDPSGRQGNPIMASMLRSIDESLGRLLDRLDELELSENTLFIFYSDNGGNVHSNVPDDPKVARPAARRSAMLQDWRKWAGDRPPTNNAPLREGKGRIYEGGVRTPLMIRWPGRIAAGSTCDAVVGPIDLYPTVLDAVQRTPAAGQVVDGESLLPVLEQRGSLQREAYFTWFPHLIPAVSVRQGSWKLIRRFQPHPQYPELLELYDLSKDLGETRNLAAEMPEKTAELNSRIDEFVKRTGALYPQPNPAYQARPPAAAESAGLQGLVPRFCKATLVDGALRIEAEGRNPFLGTAQAKSTGPLELRMRLRSESGGEGRIQWKTQDQETFPEQGQTVGYRFEAGQPWREVTVQLPVEGRAGIVRIYLPAGESPVEIQSILFRGANGVVKQWRFGGPDR